MEKRRDRAKLIIAGAREMCSTIMSKVFKCNGIAVLAFLLQSLQCLHKLCYYYAIEFEDLEVKNKVECDSIYNPMHPPTVQMDCFRHVAEIQHFLKRVKPLIDDIESEYKAVRLIQISRVISHFLQDFVVRNSDFHAVPPPPFKIRKRKASVWRY